MFVEDAVFFTGSVLVSLLKHHQQKQTKQNKKKQVPVGLWSYIWAFDFVSLINVSIFMALSCCFYYYSSVDGDTPVCSFIIKDCFS